MTDRRTALVTGANRGIGLEVCRQLLESGLQVILTGRNRSRVEAAADSLAARGELLDLVDPAAPTMLWRKLESEGVDVDVVVNNAVAYDSASVFDVDDDTLNAAIATNLVGAWAMMRAFVPPMIDRGYGRVINVSSGWGSFDEGLGGPPTYAVTKAALNALTVVASRDVSGDVTINAMCPDWVDSAGSGTGGRPVSEGADTIAWLASHPSGGPNGGFFRDRHSIAW